MMKDVSPTGIEEHGSGRGERAKREERANVVFVGRERELRELGSGLDEALSGSGRLFLLSGEPGIGKSRAADEFATSAREQGVQVLRGRCWEGGGAPAYWPWVQAIRSLLRGADPDMVRDQMGGGAPDIAQMLPELHELFPELPSPPSTDPESARFRLFDSTASFLVNAAAGEPLVVILDDLHAADTPSLLFLRFLAGALAETRILLVGAYRDVELTPEHPLTKVVAELGREPITRELHLGGLREDDVAAFIRAIGGVEPRAPLVSALYRETGGNPLFLGEAVRLLAAEGRLGEMSEAGLLRVAVPSRIREVIERRLGHLTEPCGRAMAVGSVLGPEFSLEVLGRVGELSREQVLDLLDEADREGLLDAIPGALDRFRFSHDLVRETLYEELSSVQRIRLHRRAAEVLEEIYATDPEPHLAELAYHYFEAARGGDPGKAVEFGRRAGDQAARSLAYEEAARLYRMALKALELEPSSDEQLAGEMLLALGDAQARGGDLSQSRETFLRAATIARRAGAAGQMARAALGYGGRFLWARAGNDPHLVPLLQDALVLLGASDDRMRIRLLTRLACALRDSPDREGTSSLSKQAVDMAGRLNDPSTLAYALVGRIWSTWWPENPRERLEIAAEVVPLAEEIQDGELIVDGRVATWGALTELGVMGEARAEAEEVARIADELRQPAQRWVGEAARALLLLLEGSFGPAENLIQEALRTDQPTSVRDNVSAARFQMFTLRRAQGRVGETEAMVRSSVEDFPWYPLHRAALACLLADLGRMDEARAVLKELARDDFGALHRDNEWVLGSSLAAEACWALGEKEGAAVLYDQLLPFRGRHAVGHAEGSVGAVDRYLGLLATTLGRLEDAKRHLEEAIGLNERMGARPWAAHCRHDLATMLLAWDAPGDRERAEDLLQEALSSAREMGMVALVRKVSEVLGESPTPAPAPASPAGRSVFRQEGEYWSIAFDGGAFRLRDLKGLRYLARLLAEPGREFHVLDLVAAERGAGPQPGPAESELGAPGDAGEVLDAQARAAYRDRLAALEEDIEEARTFGDTERAARAEEERDLLASELAGAVGLGGRPRRAGSEVERARVSVTQAIRTALARIREQSSPLGAHLDRTVRTGTFCSYVPDPRAPVDWRT